MTTEEIATMPAGPEMDALIDEKIFGIDRIANSPFRICQAMYDSWVRDDDDHKRRYLWNGTEYALTWNAVDYPILQNDMPWMWMNRCGQPWQKDIEAQIAAWRAPPSRPWSTDIGAAWEIVEKLLLYVGPSWKNGAEWGAGDDIDFIATARVASLAICRAALLMTLA